MNPILDLPLMRRLRISIASSLLRGADVDLVFELRQVRADSKRDIVGRRLGRVESIDEARDLYDSTPVAAGYYHDLSVVGLIARSATNAPILDRRQPERHEPEKHAVRGSGSLLPGNSEFAPVTAKPLADPLPGNDDLDETTEVMENVKVGGDGGMVIDDAGPVPARAWEVPADAVEAPDLRFANGHAHNTAGPLKANAAGVYVPSCTVCGEPQG